MPDTTVKDRPTATKYVVAVIYNGLEKSIEANPKQAVQALLQHALNAFGGIPNAHTLSLFTEDGRELQDNMSVEDAGVLPGAKLLLRPSQVKGG